MCHRLCRDIYVCRLFKTVADGGPWYKYSASGTWKGVTAGGCTNEPAKAQNNPQFYVAMSRPGNVYISLEQVPLRASAPDHAIGFSLANKKGKRVKTLSGTADEVMSSDYVNSRKVVAEGVVKPFPQPLTLFASTFYPGKEAGFRITLYSDVPLDPAFTDGDALRLIPATVEAK
jgi:hypothetical protein